MRNKFPGYILGGLEIAALLQDYRHWLSPFTATPDDGFSQLLQVLTGSLSIILLLLPITGIYFIYRNKRLGFILLASFPLACIIFGITAFPVVSYFFGSHVKLNSLFTAFTNALVCAAAFWFFVSAYSNFGKIQNSEFTDTR